MINRNVKQLSRIALALVVLLSGLALVPFTELSAEKLDWQRYAGIYQPDLDVAPPLGAPGSAFVFTGSGYPANTLATIYADGNPIGTAQTDGGGGLQFAILTDGGDNLGLYYITAATGANASATNDFTLDANEPVVPLPPNFTAPVIELPSLFFLPVIFNGQ
ncbi:MAG: hypothetical protein KC425_14500 [Anaerolineales bacterium]|nr:hypothetical protein [Anaerolineales bacterium]